MLCATDAGASRLTRKGTMGERRTGTVGNGPGNASARPARRRRSVLRTWLRAAAALPAAFALALPLAGLTAGYQATPAVANPDQACVPGVGSSPTGGSRETAASQAAARWFPPDQVRMATAVAGAESSWNPTAVNKAAGGNYGLWQINSVHDNLLEGRNWRKPETNAWMAYQVWDAADGTKGDGQGSWKPWSVYSSGSYRA